MTDVEQLGRWLESVEIDEWSIYTDPVAVTIGDPPYEPGPFREFRPGRMTLTVHARRRDPSGDAGAQRSTASRPGNRGPGVHP